MGIALMMEGVLSACYHICPNYSNFQFGNQKCTLITQISVRGVLSWGPSKTAEAITARIK